MAAEDKDTVLKSEVGLPSKVQGNSPMVDSPREQLIETAVKFLNNSKVIQSPISQKKAFLEKKGLTDTEIEIAINRAGLLQDNSKTVVAHAPNYSYPQPINYSYASPVPLSRWSKFREIWYTAVIIGGTVYGAYILTKKYIIPYVWGLPTKEDRLSVLEKKMNKFQVHLDETVSQLQKTVEELQATVRESCLKQDNFFTTQNAAQTPKNLDNQFAEIRAEIISLKGLLLNRHQFPTVPAVTPVIPSWQMEKTEVHENNVNETNGVDENESEA